MREPLLQVSGVSKRFGAISASRNLSFALEQGEIHALIGSNDSCIIIIINQLSVFIKPYSCDQLRRDQKLQTRYLGV